MKNKKGNFDCYILMSLMVFGIMMAGAPMVAMAAEVHTVERHPQGGTQTDTVARQGPCVIDLTAPITTGSCRLKVTDPPAELIVQRWLRTTGIGASMEVFQKFTKSEDYISLDGLAAEFLAAKRKSPSRFWDAKVRVAPRKLDASPGGSNAWKLKNVYSTDELQQAKDAAIKWANARKNYRGSRFGKQ